MNLKTVGGSAGWGGWGGGEHSLEMKAAPGGLKCGPIPSSEWLFSSKRFQPFYIVMTPWSEAGGGVCGGVTF